tara:strand:- start:9128 stop:13441 length:4314 start_codon:yes stop_codon:yes gene_type:complete
MIAKNLLLFTLNFLLIFPAGLFAQDDIPNFEEEAANGFPAASGALGVTGGSGSVNNLHVGSIATGAATGFVGGTNTWPGLYNHQASLGMFNSLVANLKIGRCVNARNTGCTTVTSSTNNIQIQDRAGAVLFEGSEVALENNIRNGSTALCNIVEASTESMFNELRSRSTDKNTTPHRVYSRVLRDEMANILLNGSETQEDLDGRVSPSESIGLYNRNLMQNLFEGIENLCRTKFKATSNSQEYCSNRGNGAIANACKEYMKQVADPDHRMDALDDDFDSVPRILTTHSQNFESAMTNDNVESGVAAAEPSGSRNNRNGGLNTSLTSTEESTCDNSRGLCFFTHSERRVNTGNLCNEFDCTMIGNAESVFGQDNSQIMNYLSNWAGIDESLNTIGDEAYCNGCMEDKHQQLSTNKDFTQSKEDMRQKVNDKLKEMMAKRALLDHASYIENILDMNAIMQAGQLSRRGRRPSNTDFNAIQPNDMFCADEIQGVIDMTACGAQGLERDQLRSRNREILSSVLSSLDIPVSSVHGLTGEKIKNSLIVASEGNYRSSCDGDKSVGKTNGRTRFVMDKMAKWNIGEDRYQKNELNELLNNLITTNGIHNSNILADSMQSICSGETSGTQQPRVKIAEMTSEVIDTLILKINSGEVSCNENLPGNNKYSFDTNSMFYRVICDQGTDGSQLGQTLANFESKNYSYTSDIQNHIPFSLVERATANPSINSQLRRAYIKDKVEDLIAKSINSDPRYGATLGSWDNMCDAYNKSNELERDNDASTNFEFGDYLSSYKDLDEDALRSKFTALRNTNCGAISSKLRAVMCEDSVDIDPENNIQKYAGLNFNAEDIANAVREVASDLSDADKLALSSYSCEIRSSMMQNELEDSISDIAQVGLFDSILDSAMDRPVGSISSIERENNPELRDRYLASGGNEFDEARMCNEGMFCKNVNDLSASFGWDIDCEYDPQTIETNNNVGGTTSNSGSGSTTNPWDVTSGEVQQTVAYTPSKSGTISNSPSSNNVGSTTGNVSSGNINGFVGDVSNGIAGARTNADSGVGTNTGIENGSGPQAGLTQTGGADLLSSFSNGNGSLGSFNANGNVGNSNTDFSFMEKQISQLQSKQREDMLNAANDENQNSRGPASIDMPSDMDIANMSEDELRALSERLGIDMNELRGNSAKTSKELKNEDENAIGQLLKAMEEQNKSNQDMIAALQEQNSNLTQRLARIESAASASVSNSSNVEVEGDVNASAAFRSNNFAFDLDSNSFRNKATITGEERQSFSPDFASSGQNLSTANFSSYSDSRRSAMRSRDSDINREFLSLIAGESGSYDAVETSRESVERYVDFVNEKGSIVHLVRYDESGRPVSIKVPWSNEEIRLVGEYAALMSKIPPQSEALASEESDYGLYKMVEFSQSLQTFFASEAQEQVQLSSLISELDSAETSVE